MGELLAKPKRNPRSGSPRSNHCAHHDDPYVLDQCGPSQNLLRQVHRRLSGHLFRHGLRIITRYVFQTTIPRKGGSSKREKHRDRGFVSQIARIIVNQ